MSLLLHRPRRFRRRVTRQRSIEAEEQLGGVDGYVKTGIEAKKHLMEDEVHENLK